MCLGIPARVVAIVDAAALLGKVEIGGVRRVVNLACVVDDARPPEDLLDQWVLVHVGFALSRIDPDEARRTLELLEGVDLADDELDMLRADARREGHAIP